MSLSRALLPIMALLVAATAQAEVYRYIDSNGNLVLTDSPPKDKAAEGKVEKIETKPIMTVPAFQGGAKSAATPAAKKPSHGSYEIVIQNPEPGATYQKNAGESIPVAVSVSPSVAAGQRLVYLLDGKEQDGAIGSLSSESFDRGTHRLEVRVVNESGDVLSKAAVEFNIQQTSALGPTAPRPKPK